VEYLEKVFNPRKLTCLHYSSDAQAGNKGYIMRTIMARDITRAVKMAVIKANTVLPPDIIEAIKGAYERESVALARRVLGIMLENAELAQSEEMALCQDTGMVVVHVGMGQDLHIKGSLEQAVNQGIREGYREGHFRASVVGDPIRRENTGDNTPAIIHLELVQGSSFTLTVFPKGAGSENMGLVGMLKPGAGQQGVIDFVVEAVKKAGGKPCPPLVVGVGVGGNLETAPILAKKALMRPLDNSGPNQEFENAILQRINETGIGPQGLGGDTTALGVNLEVYATHIASLPVAVNLGCHSTRRYTVEL